MTLAKRDTIYFDGECGFCRHFVDRWRPTLERAGFAICALQEPGVMELFKLPEAELLRDIRCVTSQGEHLSGADVYRYAGEKIWWATPLMIASKLPGLRQLVNRGYRLFADNRHRISKSCGLDTTTRQ